MIHLPRYSIAILIGSLLLLSALATADEPAQPQPFPISGIENVYVVSERLLGGGTPENEAAFERLKKLGVTTIVSVDGARPNLEAAKKLGLRYIHLPVGYAGISTERQAELLKSMQVTEGKLFVHCHHGKHRGPAAVAIIERLTNGWSNEQARAYMERAGTSPSYRGLWRAVAECQPVTSDLLEKITKDLPESVAPPTLVKTMLVIDDHWDHFAPLTKGKAELNREQTAQCEEASTQLKEALKEWMRQDDFQTRPAPFRQAARDMLSATEVLAGHLKASANLNTLQTAAKEVSQQCVACHAKFRDGS